MTPIQRARSALIAIALVAGSLAGSPSDARGAGTEPFFSEYIEGPTAAFAKAVEIYNPTPTPIDLSTYVVELYSNGSTTASTITLSGILGAADVFVIANPSSAAAVIAQTDLQSATLNFNGNDAVALRRTDTGDYVDVIGQVGVDPGVNGWGTPPLNTTDSVLRRHASITAGDTDPTNAFDPATEWDPQPNDDYTGIGSHAADGGSSSGSVDAEVTMAGAAACLELSATAISFGTLGFGVEDAPATPSVTLTNCAGTDGTLYASGTDATGFTANWSLVDSTATCADSLGVDNFRLNLASADLGAPVSLATSAKSVQTLAGGAETTHTARMFTPCPGSSGDGETVTFQINYLATE